MARTRGEKRGEKSTLEGSVRRKEAECGIAGASGLSFFIYGGARVVQTPRVHERKPSLHQLHRDLFAARANPGSMRVCGDRFVLDDRRKALCASHLFYEERIYSCRQRTR
jgi:hypothetical protein